MNQYIEFMEIESQIDYLRFQLETLELKRDSLNGNSRPGEGCICETSFEFVAESVSQSA